MQLLLSFKNSNNIIDIIKYSKDLVRPEFYKNLGEEDVIKIINSDIFNLEQRLELMNSINKSCFVKIRDKSEIFVEMLKKCNDKEKEYHKTVDILVTFSNKIKDCFITIDVELNSQRPEDINFRNYLYINKIVTDKIEKGIDTRDYEKYLFLQLNLNVHKFRNNVGEKIYSIKEDDTNEEFVSNVKFISKSLDYYYNIYYTKGSLITDDVVWLALLNSKNFKELEEMSDLVMNKKEKAKFIKTCKDASQDELILSE